jgi:hypothetical protein
MNITSKRKNLFFFLEFDCIQVKYLSSQYWTSILLKSKYLYWNSRSTIIQIFNIFNKIKTIFNFYFNLKKLALIFFLKWMLLFVFLFLSMKNSLKKWKRIFRYFVFFEYFLPRSLVKVNSRQFCQFWVIKQTNWSISLSNKKLPTKKHPNDTWLNDYFFPHLHPFDHSRTVECPPLKSNLLYTRWKSDTPTFVWFTKLHNVNVYKEHIFPIKLYLILYQ